MGFSVDSRKCTPSMPVDERDSRWRERLAWGATMIDLREITAENAEEWLYRFRFLEQCGLEPVEADGPMTMEAIQRWTGLTMNVNTLPRKRWLAKVMRHIERGVPRAVDGEMTKARSLAGSARGSEW